MAKQQKIVIKIPRGIRPSDRESLAFDIIAYVQERTTTKSVDKNGNKFAPYSKEYRKEKKSSKVDLMDTGDMLIQLTLLTHRSGSITIGYPAGDKINGKVEGNRLGTYGNKTPIPGKARDFLGLTDKELKSLYSRYVVDEQAGRNEEALDEQVQNLDSAIFDTLERQSFLRRFGFVV